MVWCSTQETDLPGSLWSESHLHHFTIKEAILRRRKSLEVGNLGGNLYFSEL